MIRDSARQNSITPNNNNLNNQMNKDDRKYKNNHDVNNDTNNIHGLDQFSMVVVNNIGDLYLLNLNDNVLPISLENVTWLHPKWNRSKNYLAILRLDTVKNMFLYDLNNSTLFKATNYTLFGIDDYLWLDDKNILFLQGDNNSKWLHNYDIDSKSITKLFQVDAAFKELKISHVGDIYVFKSDEKILLKAKDGKDVATIPVQYQDGKVVDISFLTTISNIGLIQLMNKDNVIQFYLILVTSTAAIDIISTNKIFAENILYSCAFDENNIYALTDNKRLIKLFLTFVDNTGWIIDFKSELKLENLNNLLDTQSQQKLKLFCGNNFVGITIEDNIFTVFVNDEQVISDYLYNAKYFDY
ncbi:MAG: hypothetical protein NZZ41_02450 [Candidatus Dojkabacteria bacterium]|nr:hypothetical protein [Candidatus Dojkabacteria bacterium]